MLLEKCGAELRRNDQESRSNMVACQQKQEKCTSSIQGADGWCETIFKSHCCCCFDKGFVIVGDPEDNPFLQVYLIKDDDSEWILLELPPLKTHFTSVIHLVHVMGSIVVAQTIRNLVNKIP